MCREIGGREKVQMPLSVFRMQKRARTRPQKRASKNLEPSVTDYLRKCRNDEDRPRHQAERNCKRLNQATPYCTSSQVSFGREVCCTKYRECGDFYRRQPRIVPFPQMPATACRHLSGLVSPAEPCRGRRVEPFYNCLGGPTPGGGGV